MLDGTGTAVVEYTYDAWGNILTCTGTAVNVAKYNPLRYRGYYYDEETGYYYLQSRYYDPEIGRWISADDVTMLGANGDFASLNLYAYCGNNPVSRSDSDGYAWETAFDVVSLGFSIAEVIITPTDPWAWIGFAGDMVDLIPFVTGIGEATKAIKVTVSLADGAEDVVDAARKSYWALSKLDGADAFIKATGSYEIIYKSGTKYVGKGGFYRSTISALEHTKDSGVFDEVISISWLSSPNTKTAFIYEYARQKLGKFGENPLFYNKIWSPGKRYVGG